MNGNDASIRIDPSDDGFGLVLNCAVRYALGRRTYVPSSVASFITPLLPHVSDTTLGCFERDLSEAIRNGNLGDPSIDAPVWHGFKAALDAERRRRSDA